MARETSPLLSKKSSNYQANGSNSLDDSSSLDSIVTTTGSDEFEAIQKANDELLKKRLNGASIYAVCSG